MSRGQRAVQSSAWRRRVQGRVRESSRHQAQARNTPVQCEAAAAILASESPAPVSVGRSARSSCVCYFVLFDPILGNRYGPGVSSFRHWPGVAGSSPSTLTTSLTIPVPSSSSSNGPTIVTVITMGLCHGSSAAWAGPLFVRTHR